MTELDGRWRRYLRERRRSDVAALSEAHPERRSLYVDMVDLHQFDADLADRTFADPDLSLAAGTSVLRDAVEASGLVHLRVENNPHQCSVRGIRAREVHGLVTVAGVVETVGPPEVTTVDAAYECPDCDASLVRSPVGVERRLPTRCDSCGRDGDFEFRPSRSRFVDLQRITVGPLDQNEEEPTGGASIEAHLDDDIAGTLVPGDRYRITGIVRVRETDDSNRFEPYLDALSLAEDQRPSGESHDGLIDAYWEDTGGD
ncbi:MAG: hypothetical protein ABEH56_07860 [Salinirussus sp.]